MIEFVAEAEGPPRRRFYITHDPEFGRETRTNALRGWFFVVSEFGPDGKEMPLWDVWDETFAQIVRYPERYGSREMIWRNAATGEVVDIYSDIFP